MLPNEPKTFLPISRLYIPTVHTINCVCHSIMSMFKVLGIYNFDSRVNIYYKIGLTISKRKYKKYTTVIVAPV